jgi:polygalacturonase
MNRRDAVKWAASGGLVLQAGQGGARAADLPVPGGLDVKAFGAKADGKTLDTAAINKAIDAAAAAGGGTVVFSAGTYASYSIHLKSKVSLYLGPGATILAADPPPPNGTGGYDDAEPMQLDKYQDYGHSHFHNSLIWGEGLEDIGILGPGMIYGKGLSKGTGPGLRAEDPHVGNKAISLKNCHNVVLRDFAILQGGHFGILATGIDNFTIDNLRIDTNRDGMDIDCCRNVRVSNCSVNSPWDDAICLKSSFGLGHAKSTEMVTITNCQVSGSFALGSLLDGTFKPLPAGERIPRTGRIKFGTESNGGFKNVTITNCVFDGCQGLALETVDGAIFEDVAISNITMRDIISAPIFMRLGSRMRGPAGVPVGVMRRVVISNIVCSNTAAYLGSIISGIPGHPIENVKISDVYVQHAGGGSKENAALMPAEKEDTYPEPGMFGTMPSHGFYIRHAKNIELSNIQIETVKPEARPVFVMNDVEGVDLFRIKAPRVADVPACVLTNVRNFTASASKPLMPDTQVDRVEQSKI